MKAPRKLQSVLAILVALCLASTVHAQTELSDQASLDALVRSYFTAFAQKDLAALVKLWSERSPDLAASVEEAQRRLALEDYSFSDLSVSRVRLTVDKAILQVVAAATITNTQTKAVRREQYVRIFALIKERAAWKVWREAAQSVDLLPFLEKGSEWKVSRDSIEQFANVLVNASTDEQRNRLLADNKQMLTAELRDALIRRAGPLQAVGRHDSVITVFRIALAVAERMGDKQGIAIAERGIGDALLASGHVNEALQDYQRALAGFEAVGSSREKAITLASIAQTYFAQRNYAAAIANYEKALAEYEALKSSLGIANTLEEIASVYYEQENYDRALEYFERCLRLRETIGGKAEIASTLNSIGNVYFQQLNYPAAITQYQKSLAAFEALNDADAIVSAISNIGSALYSNGDYDAALDYYQKGLKFEGKLRDRRVMANLRLSIATVHSAQGNYSVALENLVRALTMFEEIRDKTKMAGALSDIGEAYLHLRNYPLALEHYEKSLKIYAELKSLADTSMRLYAIGNVHFVMSNFGQAIESYQKALGQFQDIKHAPGVASMLASIAGVHYADQKYDLAIEFYQKSLAQHEALGDKPRAAGVTERIGSVYYSTGDFVRSLEFATRAVSISEQINSLDTLWRARLTQGFAYRGLGQIDQARQSFEQSIAAIESLRGKLVRGEADAQRFFQGKNLAYVSMMELLLAQNQVPEAFLYAERIKSHQLRDIFQSPRARITSSMTAADQTAERALENDVVLVKARINRERERKQPDRRRLADLEARLQKALQDYHAFEAKLYAAHPRLKMLRGEGEPLTPEQTIHLLPDSVTALLEFIVADSKTYLFVLTRELPRQASPARTKALALTLNAYVLNIGRSELAERITRFRAMIAGRDEKVQQNARELHDLLLAQAAEQLGGRHTWLIAPDDLLWQLPFQALQSADNRYLIQDHAIAYAPSLTSLGEMAKPREPGRVGRLLSVALFANPVISKETANRAKFAGKEGLDPSPEAEAEVNSIERLYRAGDGKAFIGAQASEEIAKREAGKYRIIHFATPAQLNDANPIYSHVVLSQSEENGNEDGLLEAWELARLDLRADVLVLSGSETVPARAGGDAMTGLVWASFVAGCPTTLISRWKTDPGASSAMMIEFHREASSTPRSRTKAEALRRGALKLLKLPQFREPFYWAGFALLGSTR